jgi:hypothetical protein
MNNYQRFYRQVVKGVWARPRGLQVTYKVDTAFGIEPGTMIRRPKDNPAVGFAELLQFLAGTFSIDAIAAAAPNARLELFTEQSAYGPRTLGQLESVVSELKADEDSRRAVMIIARPQDLPSDRPCTLTMQFQLLGSGLHCTTTMRSSDLVWGLPYDIIQFGGVAMAVANCLGTEAASLTINAGNSHVYDLTRLDKNLFDDQWEFFIPKFDTIGKYRTWAQLHVDANYNRKQLEQLFAMQIKI